jgi:hypothetical protein
MPRVVVCSPAKWDLLAPLTLVSLVEEELSLRRTAQDFAKPTSFADNLGRLVEHDVKEEYSDSRFSITLD